MINMLARATDTTMFINEWFQWCIIYITYTAIYNYLTNRGQKKISALKSNINLTLY